jgi:hypothetical protein
MEFLQFLQTIGGAILFGDDSKTVVISATVVFQVSEQLVLAWCLSGMVPALAMFALC